MYNSFQYYEIGTVGNTINVAYMFVVQTDAPFYFSYILP